MTDIHKKTFFHTGVIKNGKVDNCPFNKDETCTLEGELVCSYNTDERMPDECLLRKGSVTEIYYLE
jgi:hypothetical protein